MEKLYVITHDDGRELFKTFLEQEGQVYQGDWKLPIKVEYGESWLKLSEEEFGDNAIYSL